MKTIEKYISICGQSIMTKRIIHEERNNVPTIIMLHDALGSIEQWKDFPYNIAEKTGCNILLFDRLGHGRSNPRIIPLTSIFFADEALSTLPQIITKLKLKNFILYGHSDGGTIALLYTANRFTPKPLALIAEASHVFNEEKTIAGINNTIKNSHIIIQKLKKYHGDKADTLFWNWANLWLSEKMKNWNIKSKLKTINTPTLIIQGKNDEYGTINQVNDILDNIPSKGKKLIIEDCGHFPHKEKPAQVIEGIAKFIVTVLK